MRFNFRNLFSTASLLCALSLPAFGQNFDTSGTSSLSGAYLFRYVAYFNDVNTGAVTEGCSVSGTMTFDGKGAYSTSGTQVYDSLGSQGACAAPSSGTYGVQSNGIMQMDNPLFAATLFGTFSSPVLSASSTEDDYFDHFVAVKAPAGPFATSNISGTYTLGSLEFQNGQNAFARQGYFTINTDGNGGISPFSVNGSAVNLGTAPLTQSVSGATYNFAAGGVGSLNVPLQGSSTAQTQIISGNKVLYVSADGNYVIGGSTTGLDMIFGFKAASSGLSNSVFTGSYFVSGMDADLSSSFYDAFYGTITANGAGTAIWHERLDDIVDVVTFDEVFHTTVNLDQTGFSNDSGFITLVGNGGQAVMFLGSGQQYSLNIGVKTPNYTPGAGPWINPVGIGNAANYTGITNAVAAGELVNIYGNFGVSTQVAQSIPIATSLGGVQVSVNGIPAPVYLVSANQLSVLVPYGVDGQNFGTFQVTVNGVTSNAVTVYVDYSAPGIYTLGQNGIGPSAILHSNYTPVTSSSPALPNETVLLFLNGLGTVTPTVADGAAGPSSPLSNTDGAVAIFLNDGIDTLKRARVSFAGLAPGFPGLYQVNFTVPATGLRSGNNYVYLETVEADVQMSTISLSGFSGTSTISARPAPARQNSAARKAAIQGASAAISRSAPRTASHRRGLATF